MKSVLRPLGFGETLDTSLDLYRSNFAVMFGMALVPQIPIVLFWLLAPVLLGNSADSMSITSLFITPYQLLVFVLTAGALTYATAQAYAGEQPEIGASLRNGLRRWLPLTAVCILAFIMIVFGMMLLFIPGLILMAMYFAIVPATVLEERGPLSALGRSRALSRGARMRVLGITLVAYLIAMLPGLALWAVAGASPQGRSAFFGAATGDLTWLTAVLQACSALVSAVTWPFLIIVTTVLYFDRRARTEAPDLEAAADLLQHSTP